MRFSGEPDAILLFRLSNFSERGKPFSLSLSSLSLSLSVGSIVRSLVLMTFKDNVNVVLGLIYFFHCSKTIIYIHYHTPKQKNIKFKPRRKLNHDSRGTVNKR